MRHISVTRVHARDQFTQNPASCGFTHRGKDRMNKRCNPSRNEPERKAQRETHVLDISLIHRRRVRQKPAIQKALTCGLALIGHDVPLLCHVRKQ